MTPKGEVLPRSLYSRQVVQIMNTKGDFQPIKMTQEDRMTVITKKQPIQISEAGIFSIYQIRMTLVFHQIISKCFGAIDDDIVACKLFQLFSASNLEVYVQS